MSSAKYLYSIADNHAQTVRVCIDRCTNSTQTSNSNAWPKPCKSWPPRRHRETLKKASANRGDLRVKTMQPRVRSGVRIVRRRSDTRLQCFDPQQTLLR